MFTQLVRASSYMRKTRLDNLLSGISGLSNETLILLQQVTSSWLTWSCWKADCQGFGLIYFLLSPRNLTDISAYTDNLCDWILPWSWNNLKTWCWGEACVSHRLLGINWANFLHFIRHCSVKLQLHQRVLIEHSCVRYDRTVTCYWCWK